MKGQDLSILPQIVPHKKPPTAEAKLETRYGTFNIRVYPDQTTVLWRNIPTDKPILTRVHSECLTGDVFGSCKCDCGEQLHNAMNLIQKEGGILIYLRQEGRGIGLFEKIRAYNLQEQGYDTLEANVLLGHPPDARTYEMAARALKDLNVEEVHLLTNNPSKVSALKKYGIQVLEIRPISIKPNKHNRKYLHTKEEKFLHSFKTKFQKHAIQFHPDTPTQVREIADYLNSRKDDELVEITVGINAYQTSLRNSEELEKVKALHDAAIEHDFIPALHFSFAGCKEGNVREILEEIRVKLGFFKRLHINDLPRMNVAQLELAAKTFQLDIPLSNEDLHVVKNKRFQALVKSNLLRLYLDNSRGKGIHESRNAFIRKIYSLLDIGLNNIGICGGFGPDNLDDYFHITDYFKIQFSIDAETHLRTHGAFDSEKCIAYLRLLLNFDKPKIDSVKQTRDLLDSTRNQRKNWNNVTVLGRDFVVKENVFHPGIFPSTEWFAEKLLQHIEMPCRFCEIGSGSGAISSLVALADLDNDVVATDISPDAYINTKLNAERLGIADQLKVCRGDVMDGITKGQKFDYIFWALPFGLLNSGEEINLEEIQVFDPGYRAIRKFLKTAKDHLKPKGKLLLGFSDKLGSTSLLQDLAKLNNLNLTLVTSTHLKETESVDFQILEGVYY